MSVGAKDLKVQIAFKVNKVNNKSYYGIDKSFMNKIEVGDLILIQGNLYDSITSGYSGKTWDVIITNKGISKLFKSSSRLNCLFNRIAEYEQIGLI